MSNSLDVPNSVERISGTVSHHPVVTQRSTERIDSAFGIPMRYNQKQNAWEVLVGLRGNDTSWYPKQWAPFGGKLEAEEDIIPGLIREVQEETTVIVPQGRIHAIGHRDEERSGESCRAHFFLIDAEGLTFINNSKREHKGLVWISVQNALAHHKKVTENSDPSSTGEIPRTLVPGLLKTLQEINTLIAPSH